MKMMDNKGFTLIELIMIIAILALLAILATPNVVKYIDKNDSDNYNSTIDSIEKAIDLYISDNRYSKFNKADINGNLCNIEKNGNIPPELTYNITLNDLIISNNISSPVENFCLNEEIPSDTKIVINFNCKTKKFSYDIDEETSNLKRRKDNSGNDIPYLEGLKLNSSCKEIY